MNKQKILKILEATKDEWTAILERQGEDWEGFERQEGEIDGTQTAIDLIKEAKV